VIVPLTDIKALHGLGAEHKEKLLKGVKELEEEHDEEAKT